MRFYHLFVAMLRFDFDEAHTFYFIATFSPTLAQQVGLMLAIKKPKLQIVFGTSQFKPAINFDSENCQCLLKKMREKSTPQWLIVDFEKHIFSSHCLSYLKCRVVS